MLGRKKADELINWYKFFGSMFMSLYRILDNIYAWKKKKKKKKTHNSFMQL